MVKSSSTLASIYSTSTMERHHFNQTVTILQVESHFFLFVLNQFNRSFEFVLDWKSQYFQTFFIERISTNARWNSSLYFSYRFSLIFWKSSEIRTNCRWKTIRLEQSGTYVSRNFINRSSQNTHLARLCSDDFHADSMLLLLSRLLMMGLSMTAADLCSSFKQWEVQRSNVRIIMEEFFQQVILKNFFFFFFASFVFKNTNEDQHDKTFAHSNVHSCKNLRFFFLSIEKKTTRYSFPVCVVNH